MLIRRYLKNDAVTDKYAPTLEQIALLEEEMKQATVTLSELQQKEVEAGKIFNDAMFGLFVEVASYEEYRDALSAVFEIYEELGCALSQLSKAKENI